MQVKKYLVIGTAVATIALASASAIVFADTTVNADTNVSVSTSVTSPAHQSPMVLQVGPGGRALLRGTVDTVSNTSLTVKSWGGDWTVTVGASAKVTPNSDLSGVKTGDFVGVEGAVDQTAAWTINATLVRDWTERKTDNQQAQQNHQEVKQAEARTYVGTASNVSANSLTLTAKNGTAYTVNIATDAKILNKKWLTLSVSGIANGDTVRVYGVNTSGTISATVVRDISK